MLRRLFGLLTPGNSSPGSDAGPSGPTLTTLDEAGAGLAALSAKPLRPFSTRDFGREEYPEARSVLVDAKRAETLVRALRRRLGPGLVAFVGTQRSLASPRVQGVEVVVGCGTTQFDILRIAAADALNYDKQTEDLVEQLRQWDKAFGIDIVHAETDTIEFQLKSLPQNLAGFAAAVYEFCPDSVDQGVGSVDKLAQTIRDSQRVYLWWD